MRASTPFPARLLRLGLAAACLLLFPTLRGGGTTPGYVALAEEQDQDQQDNVFDDPIEVDPRNSGAFVEVENEAIPSTPVENDLTTIEGEPTDDGRVRFVITFEDILPDEIESLLALAGIDAQIVLTIPEQLAEVVMLTYEWARIVAKLPFVKFVEEDPKLYLIPMRDARPVPGLGGVAGDGGGTRHRRRGLQGFYETEPYGLGLVGAKSVSDEFIDNRVICIIDSGCDKFHEDLEDNTITGTAVGEVGNWYRDGNGHGTHVAGTIAAVKNGRGLQGVIRNGKARLHVVKIFDETGESYASDAVYELERCREAGAHVVSMSYGRTASLWTGPTYFERNAYKKAYDDGMLLVAAAGNDGNSKDTYPASYEPVISVGSVDSRKRRSGFSQYNEALELMAPGDEVASTFPSDRYAYLSGTSMATPHVSGVAALVWSHFPDKTNKEIRQALVATAEDLGSSGWDQLTGHGLVRADRAYTYLSGGQGGGGGGGGGGGDGDNGGGNGGGSGGGGGGNDGGNGGGGGGGGGGAQPTCQTDPANWLDSSGTGCDWYDNDFLCNTFGRFYENYGKTALTACCNCGGGKVVTPQPPTPSPPTPSPPDDNQGGGGGGGGGPGEPGQCVDEPGWTDSYGDGCGWYGLGADRCAEYGTCCRRNGKTAADACCVCRGRMMSAAALGRNKTMATENGGGEAEAAATEEQEQEELISTHMPTRSETLPPVTGAPSVPPTTGTPTAAPVVATTEAPSGASSLTVAAAANLLALSAAFAALAV